MDNNITMCGSDNLYEPSTIDKRIIEEETNDDWIFLRDLINEMYKAKIINSAERYDILLALRKELNFFTI